MAEEPQNNVRSKSILGTLPIIFLAFIFLIVAISLLLRYSISQKLTALNAQLSTPPESGSINSILLDLSSAENDFQLASLNGSKDKLEEYKNKLSSIFTQIESLINVSKIDSFVHKSEQNMLKKNFDGKLDVSTEVFKLKKNFDSLLRVTTNESIGALNNTVTFSTFKVKTGERKLADTVVRQLEQASQTKKGLFGRLKDAFINKPDTQVVKIIEINREKGIRDSIIRDMSGKAEKERQALLVKLGLEHNRLTSSQIMLLEANRSLIIQLRLLVNEIRVDYFSGWEKNREKTLKQYQSSVNVLDSFTLIALIMVLIFILLLFISIRRASRAERQIMAENARAIALAEQKSELLAIMSHEIRNPLTTIVGYIYMLEKSTLTSAQTALLKPIKQASTLLQDTVNDILDMGKFESLQSAALNNSAFSPIREIKETIENLKFSAGRKGIYLDYQFIGIDDQQVIGDAFRLKQVLINLLSNAIKYTDTGGVIVKASLLLSQEHNLLSVSIEDTGIGLSPEQQTKLFTKYYQGKNATGKPGTGLGLYICNQLIKLQKGSIRVQSEVGKGSTFTFEIPYQPANL
ncbi:Signal transduction histidine kinase [bacterium A37T11]|nr:Signal transduction histidine kinase [bacterium A37T11]